MRKAVVIAAAAICSSVNGYAQTQAPGVSDIPAIAVAACALGAVETAYALAPDKMTGDAGKDTLTITKASARFCIGTDFVDQYLPKKNDITDADRKVAATQAFIQYNALVSRFSILESTRR